MAIVEPGKGRALIENNGSGLRIVIPAKSEASSTLFLAFWLVGWALGEAYVPYQIFFNPEHKAFGLIFMIAWLGAWTVGGVWAIGSFLWSIAGKEIIELNSMTLKRRKQIPIFSRSKEYAVASIANLRLASPAPSSPGDDERSVSSFSFDDGSICFDYGRDTHHLATGLDEADAKYVIAEMCRRAKSLCL